MAKGLKKVAKFALPVAAAFAAPALAPALGITSSLGTAALGAGLGAAGGAASGGGAKGALLGAIGGGGGSLLTKGLSGSGGLSSIIGKAVGSPVSATVAGPTQGSGLLGTLTRGTGLAGGGSSNLLSTAGNIYSGIQSSSAQDKMKKQLLEAQGKSAEALQPYVDSGTQANSLLMSKIQSGDLGGSFQPGDLTQDPGYQFRLQEGQKALDRSLAAQGGLFSGRAAKAAQEYGQGLADQTYNDAYNRWLQTQGLNYDMLSGQSGQGLNAAGAMSGVYDNQGNIRANATLGKSNILNSTLAKQFGGSGAMTVNRDGTIGSNDLGGLTSEQIQKLKAAGLI